ncbi:hypothetical protein MMC25_005066 [Agyrium rufum]|nr:hypothetical protein [Agyrium rufum]
MALSTGFQVGLELTNLLAPAAGLVTRLCNAAVEDAIKRSDSDAVTESKLAAVLGRLSIDETLKAYFRTYIDIALHSGAGPTIQNSLTEGNPALFFMIVQLSLLSFACKDQDLAWAIATIAETLLQSQGAELARAPDYVSLLGTIRTCREQTTAFRWRYQFDAVEDKIARANGADRIGTPISAEPVRKKRRVDDDTNATLPWFTS